MSVLLLFRDGGGGTAQAGIRGFFAFWMGGGGGPSAGGGDGVEVLNVNPMLVTAMRLIQPQG